MTASQKKRLIAMTGATIVLVTFLVNDVKRANLKEMADSLEAAENAFIIHTDNRNSYTELQSFEDEFAVFERNPTEGREFKSGYSVSFENSDEINWGSINALRGEITSETDLVDSLSRLAKRVPSARKFFELLKEHKKSLKAMSAEYSKLRSEALRLEANKQNKGIQEAIKKMNSEMTSSLTATQYIARPDQ
jgi:nucleoid DNA-binding protein